MDLSGSFESERPVGELSSALGIRTDSQQVSDCAAPALVAIRTMMVRLLVGVTIGYFIWRAQIINHASLWLSWSFLLCELVTALWGLSFASRTVRVNSRTPRKADGGLSVDVFVTAFNEPADIVLATLISATRIRYPHTTWLLDDGKRDDLRDMAREIGCNYVRRPDNAHAKAGNLNFGLASSEGEFILVLDADHIAAPQFLDEVLGYFVDEKVAFVQTPQEFYDADSFEHFGARRGLETWSEHSLFHRVIQRERDLYDGCMFSGSGTVLRRAALASVGGFATGTVTEDMHTSLRMHALNWKSVFHAQSMSAGLSPMDARSFSAQRLRWAYGAVQVFMQERRHAWRQLTPVHRRAYGSHVLGNFAGIRNAFMTLIPPVIMITGVPPFIVDPNEYFAVFVPYLLFNIWVFAELARGHGKFFRTEIYNLARATVSVRALRALLPSVRIRFSVTPKRSSTLRMDQILWFPLFVLALSIVALVAGAIRLESGRSQWGVSAIMAVWVGYGAFNAICVLLICWRCWRRSGHTTKFSSEDQANLRGPDGQTVGVLVSNISCDSVGWTWQHAMPAWFPSCETFDLMMIGPRGAVTLRCVCDTVYADGVPNLRAQPVLPSMFARAELLRWLVLRRIDRCASEDAVDCRSTFGGMLSAHPIPSFVPNVPTYLQGEQQ